MGDPKKARKQYSTPRHPWEKVRIDEEKALKKEYGFKNKKELWKSTTLLKNYFNRAKKIVSTSNNQAIVEQKQLLEKLKSFGLIQGDATLGDVLKITLKEILERRLQTIVFKKGLSKSIGQARQFIVHGHVKVGEKIITSPSYMVTLADENQLVFSEKSSLNNENHPERSTEKKEEVKGEK